MEKKIDIGLVTIIMDLIIPIILYRMIQSHLSNMVWFTFGLIVLSRILIASGFFKSH